MLNSIQHPGKFPATAYIPWTPDQVGSDTRTTRMILCPREIFTGKFGKCLAVFFARLLDDLSR
jgi:hypothetical protein